MSFVILVKSEENTDKYSNLQLVGAHKTDPSQQ